MLNFIGHVLIFRQNLIENWNQLRQKEKKSKTLMRNVKFGDISGSF